MTSIVKYTCNELNGAQINCVVVDGSPWFKAKDVATILGYSDKKQAVQINVDTEDKQQLKSLVCMVHGGKNTPMDASDQNITFINESGLYSLVLRSDKAEAKIFKRWVTSEVLPSIRKTGSYSLPADKETKIVTSLVHKQIKLLNEKDLHYKVIDLIRTKFPELIVVPGLGEYQTTSQIRIDAFNKGYVSGQPDLIILNQTKDYHGFALELKSPNGKGVVSEKQVKYLETLKGVKYKTIISCDYDEIVIELTNYYNELRFPCSCCSKVFKSKTKLDGHLNAFHS